MTDSKYFIIASTLHIDAKKGWIQVSDPSSSLTISISKCFLAGHTMIISHQVMSGSACPGRRDMLVSLSPIGSGYNQPTTATRTVETLQLS